LSKLSAAIIVFTIITVFAGGSPDAKVPSDDIVLTVISRAESGNIAADRIISALTDRMKTIGYEGRIILKDTDSYDPANSDSYVRLTVTKSAWQTEKALSIPYLLNRYKRVFHTAVLVEIYPANKEYYSKLIKADEAESTEAQFIQNDKYDPDLLLDQSVRLKLEERICTKLANQLADLLSKKID